METRHDEVTELLDKRIGELSGQIEASKRERQTLEDCRRQLAATGPQTEVRLHLEPSKNVEAVAAEWLREQLVRAGGRLRTTKVKARAKAAGISEYAILRAQKRPDFLVKPESYQGAFWVRLTGVTAAKSKPNRAAHGVRMRAILDALEGGACRTVHEIIRDIRQTHERPGFKLTRNNVSKCLTVLKRRRKVQRNPNPFNPQQRPGHWALAL